MKSGRKNRAKQQRKPAARQRKNQAGTLVANPAFAPLLGLWGALLGGLVVWVLPPALISDLTKDTLIATFAMPAQTVIALVMALLTGTMLFMVATARSSEARRGRASRSIVGAVSRRVRPIDPVRDLGTNSLDDPIETMPFATPAWRDAEVNAPQPEPVVAHDPAPVTPPREEPVAAPAPRPAEVDLEASFPVELDLAAFAELPGRNAVWVEEPVAPAPVAPLAPEPVAAPVATPAPAAPAPEPAAPVTELRRPAPPTPPGTAALARLRAQPTSELSLVEMVERFAGALHEHRSAMPARALTAEEVAARGTALSEALKALAALSGDFANRIPADAQASEPLRAALLQLQPRREVA